MLPTNNSVRIVNIKWSTGEKRGTKTNPVKHIIFYCYPTAGDGQAMWLRWSLNCGEDDCMDGGFINR